MIRLLGVLVCLSAACAAPTEPLVTPGRLALQTFGEHALPAVVQESGEARLLIVADTLLIAPNGTGVRRSVRQLEFLDGERPPEEYRSEARFDIRRTADGLVVTEHVVCPAGHQPEEGCGTFTATVSGDALIVGVRRYARVAVAP